MKMGDTSLNKKMYLNGSEQECFVLIKDSNRRKYQKTIHISFNLGPKKLVLVGNEKYDRNV